MKLRVVERVYSSGDPYFVVQCSWFWVIWQDANMDTGWRYYSSFDEAKVAIETYLRKDTVVAQYK